MPSFVQVFGKVQHSEFLGRNLKTALAKAVELRLPEAEVSLVLGGELLDEKRTLIVIIDFLGLAAYSDTLRRRVGDAIGTAVKAHLVLYESSDKEDPWTVKILVRGAGISGDCCDTFKFPWVE